MPYRALPWSPTAALLHVGLYFPSCGKSLSTWSMVSIQTDTDGVALCCSMAWQGMLDFCVCLELLCHPSRDQNISYSETSLSVLLPMLCFAHGLHKHVNFAVDTVSSLFWVGLISDLLCSKLFQYHSIFFIWLQCHLLQRQRQKGSKLCAELSEKFWDAVCPVETSPLCQLKYNNRDAVRWPASPLLSDKYDSSSIHLHRTFNKVFLRWSFDSLLPSPPPFPANAGLAFVCTIYIPLKAKWYLKPKRELQILPTQQAEKHLFQSPYAFSFTDFYSSPLPQHLFIFNTFTLSSPYLQGSPITAHCQLFTHQKLHFGSRGWQQSDFMGRKDIFCCLFFEFSWVFIGGGEGLRTSSFWLVGPLTLKSCHISYSGVWLTPDEEKAQRTRQTGWDTSASYCGLRGQPRCRGLMPDANAQCAGIGHLSPSFSTVPAADFRLQDFTYLHTPTLSLYFPSQFCWMISKILCL